MIKDIIIAFLIAGLINFGDNKYLKKIMIFIGCLTSIIVYFVNGCKINFIGTIDLAIWIMFIIIFDIALTFMKKIIVDKVLVKEE